MLDTFRQDARYAVRGLGRSPIFSITAILSIAIGVGGTAAIYSLANSLLFTAPTGVGNPDQVVNVGRTLRLRNVYRLPRPQLDIRGTCGRRARAEIGEPQGDGRRHRH